MLSSRALECEKAMHVAFDEKRLAELAHSALSVQHAYDSRLALGEQRLALECAATEALHAALEQQRSLLAEDKAEELALALSTLREELRAQAAAEADELRGALNEQHARAAAEAASAHYSCTCTALQALREELQAERCAHHQHARLSRTGVRWCENQGEAST